MIVKVFRILFRLKSCQVPLDVAAGDSFEAVNKAVRLFESQNLNSLYPKDRRHSDNDIVNIEVTALAEGDDGT
jgi:hypothetical protein